MKSLKKLLKILIIFLLFMLFLSTNNIVYGEVNEEDIMEENKEQFKIEDFINESKEYGGEFFQDIDIGEMLNNAISGKIDNKTIFGKILNICSKEIASTLKILISILVIIIIHSILKTISDNLENESVSKIIYYVQYILIVTIIMGNFTEIIKLVQDTANNLIGFMNLLVPLLMTLMIYTGNITTSGVLEPIILFIINFIGNMIQNIIIPLVIVFTSLIIISKISEEVQVIKIAKFLKSGIVWFLGIVLTIFVGIVSLEGTMSASVDGITAKATKAVVSSAVPVVRQNIRRCSRYCFRFRSGAKKCSWDNWCNYNNRYLYNAYNKTCYNNYNV